MVDNCNMTMMVLKLRTNASGGNKHAIIKLKKFWRTQDRDMSASALIIIAASVAAQTTVEVLGCSETLVVPTLMDCGNQSSTASSEISPIKRLFCSLSFFYVMRSLNYNFLY
jgi:hypothetical protein